MSAIVIRDGPTVWKVLWKLLGNPSDVEDCFQETFLAAVQVSRREEVEYWPALLIRLATTQAIDRLRSRYRARRRQTEAALRMIHLAARNENSVSNLDNPVELAIATELSEQLREALTELPEKQAEIFVLYALHGWSYPELADHMLMSEGAIRTALHRARERLRELLDAEFPGPPR